MELAEKLKRDGALLPSPLVIDGGGISDFYYCGEKLVFFVDLRTGCAEQGVIKNSEDIEATIKNGVKSSSYVVLIMCTYGGGVVTYKGISYKYKKGIVYEMYGPNKPKGLPRYIKINA